MVTRFSGPIRSTDVISLRNAVDRLFSDNLSSGSMRTLWSSNASGAAANVPLDVYATEQALTIIASLPGIDPADIEISVLGEQVTLKGSIVSVTRSEEARDATWFLHELPRGTFTRVLTLPFEVDADAAEATFDNGMLRLTLPRADAARPRQIRVQIGGGSREALAESASPDSDGATDESAG